ncbi:MAG: glycosyltransferase [Myxococcota bacterium]
MTHTDKPIVAKFSTNFLPYSETFVFDEVNAHRTYDVEVLALRRANADRFAVDIPVHALASGGWWGEFESRLCQATSFSPTFIHQIRARRYDVLHAHFGTGGVYGLAYQAAFNLPLVVTFHGHEVPLLSSSRRYRPEYLPYWLLSKPLLRRADLMLVVSPLFVDELIRLGAPPERVRLFNLGTTIPDLPPPAPRAAPHRVLMIGRFVEKKGMTYGIQAFAKALTEGVQARLSLAGDGPLRPVYEALIAELGIGDQVDFLGVLTHDEVGRELERTDVLLVPSVTSQDGNTEGAPTVIKEAGARYVPVVATKHGGIPSQIDEGESGFLVPERDVDALANRLQILLNTPALRASMGRAARAVMNERFNLERQVRLLEQYYDEVRVARAERRPLEIPSA